MQEEVFVVLDGTLTIHMGEGDDPERHELERERGDATFLPTVSD